MSATIEKRVKNLETAVQCLQKLNEEHFENLSNDLMNRSESQFNLMKYLFTQHQILKEMIRMVARKFEMGEKQLDDLWSEAKVRTAGLTIQDELLSEYQKDLEKDNGRD